MVQQIWRNYTLFCPENENLQESRPPQPLGCDHIRVSQSVQVKLPLCFVQGTIVIDNHYLLL